MNTETTEEKMSCSGCLLPISMVPLIPMRHGYICADCVNTSFVQVMIATRVDRALEEVRRVLAHIENLLTVHEKPYWRTNSDVGRLDKFSSHLGELARDYVCRTGPFAEQVVDEPAQPTSDAADAGMDRSATAGPALRLAVPHPEAVPVSPTARAAESRIYAIVCDLLNTELLDGPTPRMRESMERHGVDDEAARLGLQEMLDELRGHREFLDPRPHLTLVPVPAENPGTPELGAPATFPRPSAAPDHLEQNADPGETSIRAETRVWTERLEAWMTSAGLSPEELAKRARRDRATVAGLLGREDRQTSLRLFLDLARHAGARLSGAPDSTPRALFHRLKELLTQQGLTITTLARRSGIHRTQLSTLFNNPDPNPCLLTVQRIVASLSAEAEVNLVAHDPGRTALGSM